MVLLIDPGAIRLAGVHNQVHDRAASATVSSRTAPLIVSNGPTHRLERPHSACRVNFYAPTLHGVVLNFFPRGACLCREGALRIRLSACRSKQLCSACPMPRDPKSPTRRWVASANPPPSEGTHRTRRLFSHQCFVCGFDQRPCKPLAAFGQSCRTMSEIYEYREYPVACEVCNSDT
jgi:hypothetical protein